jgi:hypothetical protein
VTAPEDHAAPPPSAQPAGSAEPPRETVIVDDHGCVVDALAHGARFAVDNYAAPIGERLGRPPRLSDLTEDHHCFGASAVPDVDGDGAEEIVVTEGCTWGVHGALQLLYFSNHGCRKFAGALVSGGLRPLAGAHAGVRDLEEVWSNGCAGADFLWQRHVWNGKAYRSVERVMCSFCDDPRGRRNRDPRCAKLGPHLLGPLGGGSESLP